MFPAAQNAQRTPQLEALMLYVQIEPEVAGTSVQVHFDADLDVT